mgnify:CR=1 FL=1
MLTLSIGFGELVVILLVTLLAFMLSAAYAYLKHDGLPRFRAWMEAFEAADKRKGK